MYFRQNTLGRLGQGSPGVAQNYTIPASVGGVNALDPLIAIPPQDCFYTFNLMPSEYGLRLRKGYQEWATGVGTSNTEVRSIIPFEGLNPANNKLFAATADGIYDVTTQGTTAPTEVVTFASQAGNAGYTNWTEMTIDTGEQKLFVADDENGLFMYDETTDTWSVPAFTGGISSADVCFVTLHKQRLWVIERGTGDAYYGPVDSIAGTFTKFTFGSKFKYGGELLLLTTWTLDGGNGLDDYLVGISRGGDVLTYQGSDPSQPDWNLTGSFFVGQMPASRKSTKAYAGQLYILSTFGITSLQDLVQGVDPSDMGKSQSAKINRILRGQVIAQKDSPGWELTIHPADGFMQVIQPWEFANNAIQYNQNLLTKAWGYWNSVPMKCAETWQAEYYMGGTDGRVYQYFGSRDEVTIAGSTGVSIPFSILTSFQAVGDHATWKQNGLIRVVGVVGGDVVYNMKSIYDYNVIAEANPPSGGISIVPALWDAAIWDSGVWDGELTGNYKTEGGQGIGRTLAVAMKGESQSRITIVGWDLTVTGGGFL
jgi:hypothetical protein